jgi:hypothetical protein
VTNDSNGFASANGNLFGSETFVVRELDGALLTWLKIA